MRALIGAFLGVLACTSFAMQAAAQQSPMPSLQTDCTWINSAASNWQGSSGDLMYPIPTKGEMKGLATITTPGSINTSVVVGMRVTLNIRHFSVYELAVFLSYPGHSCPRDNSNMFYESYGCVKLIQNIGEYTPAGPLAATRLVSPGCSSFSSLPTLNSATPPYTGDFQYMGWTWEMPFYGTAHGTYRLNVFDMMDNINGTLQNWSLQLFFATGSSPSPPLSFLPPAPPPPDLSVRAQNPRPLRVLRCIQAQIARSCVPS